MAVKIYRLEPLKALFIQPILADMGHLCRQITINQFFLKKDL